MDERTIRESIRARLASGELRPDDGTLVVARTHSRPPCSACGLPIEADWIQRMQMRSDNSQAQTA